jgi:hypothetical protein
MPSYFASFSKLLTKPSERMFVKYNHLIMRETICILPEKMQQIYFFVRYKISEVMEMTKNKEKMIWKAYKVSFLKWCYGF